jgi:nucleotide sugar dehydrogenase
MTFCATDDAARAVAPREIVVVGCGAIGLPVAVALAHRGERVAGYDIDAAKIADLVEGLSHADEPELAAALRQGLAGGALSFTATLRSAETPRAFILAPPTPASATDGYDAGPFASAMAAVAAVARDDDLVCVRSTVPIGATRSLAQAHPRLRFAACPDRTLSGRAFAEQFAAPQLVGGVTPDAADAAAALFSRLGAVVRLSDAETAEAVKLFANVQRDALFALANQFAILCEAAGLSFAEVRAAGAQGYPRFALARAGPVGGPCLTKDVHVLAASPALQGEALEMLLAARRLNESLAPRLAAEIRDRLEEAAGPVAILGLAFKGEPPTLDRRGAFAEALAAALPLGAPQLEIRRWDPQCGVDPRAAIAGAAAVVLANDHPALADIAPLVAAAAPGAVVFDACGVLRDAAGQDVTVLTLGEGRRG